MICCATRTTVSVDHLVLMAQLVGPQQCGYILGNPKLHVGLLKLVQTKTVLYCNYRINWCTQSQQKLAFC